VFNLIQTSDHTICQRHSTWLGAQIRTGVISYGGDTMSLGLIIVIILVIFLLGGFSGRFGGYGYGYGHGGMGIVGTVLVVLLILLLLGKI
jgi:hypothetical protein